MAGNSAAMLPNHAWKNMTGKGETRLTVVRGGKRIGKNGNEIGISSSVGERKGIPPLAGKEKIPIASTDNVARIEKEMASAIDRIIKQHKNTRPLTDKEKGAVIDAILEHARGRETHAC